MATVAALWRHPIKSHGREPLDHVTLTEGQAMPWDRRWAVLHHQSKFDPANPDWVSCRNFVIGAMNPKVAGLWATLDDATGQITLKHADLDDLTFAPDQPDDQIRFLDWINRLDLKIPATGIATLPGRGFTDDSKPTLTIMNTASHAAVEGFHGAPLETERWRGNIWLDGLAPWEEFDWIDRDIQIGGAIIRPHKRTERCKHTTANPRTGDRDADTLAALNNGFGHQDFGIAGVVIQTGKIALGDTAKVL
jgi:uncharacterized protein YcbX